MRRGYKRSRNGVFPDKKDKPWASAAYLCARFWPNFVVEDKCRKNMKTPCWRWTARVNHQGYGIISFSHATLSQRTVRAHRVTLMLKLGRWPKEKMEHACHVCHFPRCVNPLHIYCGNDATNSADKARAGRVVTKWKTGCQPHNQIYTNEQMQLALDLYYGTDGNGRAKRKESIQSLAREYCVTDAVIRRVIKPGSQLSQQLNKNQREEIKSRYFGPDGQGSVCPPGSTQAKWTAASISSYLGIAKHAIQSAILGNTFAQVYRPAWARQYKERRTIKQARRSKLVPKQ